VCDLTSVHLPVYSQPLSNCVPRCVISRVYTFLAWSIAAVAVAHTGLTSLSVNGASVHFTPCTCCSHMLPGVYLPHRVHTSLYWPVFAYHTVYMLLLYTARCLPTTPCTYFYILPGVCLPHRVHAAPIYCLVFTYAMVVLFQFIRSLSLSGHEDWVRCLQFITTGLCPEMNKSSLALSHWSS